MADYYPLIARAVQGLADPSPAMREAVYGRARAALMAQLRSLDPPLSDEDIDREGTALDDAIARVEAAFAPPVEEEPTYEPEQEPEPVWEPEPVYTPPPSPAPSPAPPAPPPAAARDPYPEPDPAADLWPEAEVAASDWPEASPEPRPSEPVRPLRPSLAKRAAPVEAGEDEPSDAGAEPAPSARPRRPGLPGRGKRGPAAAAAGAGKLRPRIDARAQGAGSGGKVRIAIIAGALLLVAAAIAFTAISLSGDSAERVAETTTETTAPAVEDGKIAERIGGDPAPAPASPVAPAPTTPPVTGGTGQDIAVAQRAVLYEEDPINPQGQPRAAAGRAVWTLEPGGQGEPVVRAVVEIPEPQLRLVMLVRRNLDPTLPASHTIDISFETGDLESRRVRDIGLLQLKDQETVRGAPVAGLPVPVRDNLFLIGLSNLPRDIERNVALMTDRNWIDLPVRLASGQRAILSFEKGASGDRILDEAFEAWNGAIAANGG